MGAMTINRSRVGLGRGFLILAYLLLLLTLVVLPVLVVRQHGIADATSPLFRLVLALAFIHLVVFGTLGWFLWLGHVWARWVVALLLFVIALISLTFISEVTGAARLILVGKVVLDLATAAFVAFSGPIGEYLLDRERARKINL
jgi:hypothetical protein